MSLKLVELVQSLVSTAPLGEIAEVRDDLRTIAGPAHVNKAVAEYFDKEIFVTDGYVFSSYNRDERLAKYVDHVRGEKFGLDVSTLQAVDIERFEPSLGEFESLVKDLEAHGDAYFPLDFAFTVVPRHGGCDIVAVGLRENKANFYTGRWKAVYSLDGTELSGFIDLDIHYYEDGNVRLRLHERVLQTLGSVGDATACIAEAEQRLLQRVFAEYETLNQEYFKNLRRLLPVTKLKINWGSAIGNYRLGLDVVNG